MSKITLIISDLDGTLLTPNGQIAPETKVAIQAAHNQGIPTILATTRNLPDVQRFCQTLIIHDPIICTNGAHVLASPNGPLWAYHTIPQEIALEMAHRADKENWELTTTVDTITYLRQRPGQSLGPISDTLFVSANNADGVVGNPIRILTWNQIAIDTLRKHCEANLKDICYAQTYYQPNGDVHSLGIFAKRSPLLTCRVKHSSTLKMAKPASAFKTDTLK